MSLLYILDRINTGPSSLELAKAKVIAVAATHCVVIIVEQKVSGNIVQSQSQGGIAEECIPILKVS